MSRSSTTLVKHRVVQLVASQTQTAAVYLAPLTATACRSTVYKLGHSAHLFVCTFQNHLALNASILSCTVLTQAVATSIH